MSPKPSYVYFIDRSNYATLFGRDMSLEDIAKLSKGLGDQQKVSSLTMGIVCELNAVMTKVLFDNEISCYLFSLSLSNQDRCYTEHYVRSFLSPRREDIHYAVTEDKKYYEIISLADSSTSDLLIVLEEGFFDYVTENKDKLDGFVLDCLSYKYRYGGDYASLMKLHLSLGLNESSLDLFKLRFN